MSYGNTRRFWDELASVDGRPVRHEYLQVRSEFFRRPLDAGTVTGLVADLTSAHRPGQQRELDFSPWGGAYNRVPTTATAFAHRDERFLLKISVDIPADAPAEERTAARSWLRESAAMAYADGSGRVFPNFADPELDDWSPSYHGENRERLLEVKAAYDPDDLFHPMQSGRPGPPAR
jgi:Berberine and berberine like